MAQVKISQLGNAAALTGAESVELVQGGNSLKTTTANIAALNTSVASASYASSSTSASYAISASYISSSGIAGSIPTSSYAADMLFGSSPNQIHIIERFSQGTGGAITPRVVFSNAWYAYSDGTAGSNIGNTEVLPYFKSWQITTGAGFTSSYNIGMTDGGSGGAGFSYTSMPVFTMKWIFKIADATSLASASVYVGLTDHALARGTAYKNRLIDFGPDGLVVGHRANQNAKFYFGVQSNDSYPNQITQSSTITADTNWHVFNLRRNGDNAYFSLDNEAEITLASASNISYHGLSAGMPSMLVTTSGSWASSIKACYFEWLIPTTGSYY